NGVSIRRTPRNSWTTSTGFWRESRYFPSISGYSTTPNGWLSPNFNKYRAGTIMKTYDEVVVGRRSIRGFLDRPVPKDLVAEVIAVAMRAPSSFNNQCWNFSVVTGAPLDAIRTGN